MSPWTGSPLESLPHVVIIGGGFAGLTAARQLRRAPVRITLIDRANHHLFQPLLYQVAMSGLSPAEIAMPIRAIVSRQRNLRVLLCEASSVDLEARQVELLDDQPLAYDYVILAAGAVTNYFGHDDWARHALGLKDIDDAIEIRRRVLLAYETAEREREPAKRSALMTFVVIGGGPTGVELAGAIAELGRWVLARDFRTIDPAQSRVVLLEGGERLLVGFHPDLSIAAGRQLAELGVEVRCGTGVTEIDEDGVWLGEENLPAWTVLWAAGVRANPLGATLGVELDRLGRVMVNQDCSIDCHSTAFAVGDLACFVPAAGGRPLPGLSPVAIQQARLVSANIRRDLSGKPRRPFRYRDKGAMATIGRSRAVAEFRSLRFSGLLAWLAWLLVHIWYLIGFRNRVIVMLNWFWAYVAFKRGARLVTGTCLHPRVRRKLEQLGKQPSRSCRE